MLRRFVFYLIVAFWAGLGSISAQTVPQSAVQMTLSFAPVVKRSAPSVVNIYASRVTQSHLSPFANDPFFSQFFNSGPSRPRVERSLGSGVIVTQSGLVVSNHHVVEGASDIRVVLTDRREFEGTVVLADKDLDIAMIQLSGADALPALPFADSDAAEVGDLVLAIGNPFGVGQTVSSGIISGLARSGSAVTGGVGSYIQTDAPTNPGNSGGALVDMAGRLVGINTSILSRSGGSNGIGFAIPSNLVAQFVVQAEQGNSRFVRAWSGLIAQPVDEAVSEALGMPVPEGVLIAALHPMSPFLAAGLTVGDVVIAVDGRPVLSPADLDYRMSTLTVGARTAVTALRQNELISLDLGLISAPDVPAADEARLASQSALDGLVVANANPALIDEYGLPLMTTGVVVLDAVGAARRLRLQRGDRIVDIDGTDIPDTQTARDIARQTRGSWTATIERDGRLLRLRIQG